MNSKELDSSINNYLKQLDDVDMNLLCNLEKRKIISKIIKRLVNKAKNQNNSSIVGMEKDKINLLNENKIIKLSKLTKKYKRSEINEIYTTINKFN